MRRRVPLLVLAGAVTGAVVALVLTLAQPPVYRADASIAIVRQGQPPGSDPELAQAAAGAAELFASRAVAESAVANLRLDETPEELLERVDVQAEPGSSLVRITVDADERDEARLAAQELAELSTILYNDRFGAGTVASILEAPRTRPDPVGPALARPLALGAGLAALAGLLLGLLLHRRPRLRRRRGPGWSIAALEQAAAAAPDEREAEERRIYLEALRDYADEEGRLDAAFDGLVDEVFGGVERR